MRSDCVQTPKGELLSEVKSASKTQPPQLKLGHHPKQAHPPKQTKLHIPKQGRTCNMVANKQLRSTVSRCHSPQQLAHHHLTNAYPPRQTKPFMVQVGRTWNMCSTNKQCAKYMLKMLPTVAHRSAAVLQKCPCSWPYC